MTRLPGLLGVLASGPLAVTLGIDLGREGVFVGQGDGVDDEDPGGYEDTGRLAVDEGGAEEAHGRAIVHGGAGDVEGEAGHDAVHQDAEVVAQEGAGDAQAQSRGDHEDIAGGNKGITGVCKGVSVEEGMRRLVAESTLVKEVAEQAQGEDGQGEGVAGSLGASSEQLGQ